MPNRSKVAVYLEDFASPVEDVHVRLQLVEAERDRWRILAGGGCDANNGGEHDITTLGGHQFCSRCGESISSAKDRILSLVNRNIRLESARKKAEQRAEAAETRCAELDTALEKCIQAGIKSTGIHRI